MNQGNSAGGGQQGYNPAPPAVLNRRSTSSTVISSILSSTASASNSHLATLTSQQQLQQQSNQQQHQQQQYHSPIIQSGSAVQNIFNPALSSQQHMTTSRYPNIPTITNQQQKFVQSIKGVVTDSKRNTPSIINIGPNQYQQKATGNKTVGSDLSLSYSSYSLSANNLNVITSLGTPSTVSSCVNNNSLQQYTTDNLEPTSTPKKVKLDHSTQESSVINSKASVTTAASHINVDSADINVLKKQIFEHLNLRLKKSKEKYFEYVAELFFLQSGGNMMEYPVWRKKPATPQFINFNKSYRLEGFTNDDTNNKINQQAVQQQTNLIKTIPLSLSTASSSTTSSISNNLPEGAEIKIPAVGATPIALSTQLPAAVVQLSQQGGKPLVPDVVPGNSNIGNVNETHRGSNSQNNISTGNLVNTSNPTIYGPAVPPIIGANANSTSASNANSQEFSVKAKQEVYVMQRIQELQREGLWTEKRLPKIQEPSRTKAHWDYLLEEMVWLAADFSQERKWKKSAAKKCARMVQKYFQDKANAAQRAEKAQELHLKRVAAFIAREVKIFWSNVEKLVEYKHHTKLEEKRKKALDQHLSFIVDQTEKFSQQLAEGMNKTLPEKDSAEQSLTSSRRSSPNRKVISDDEFRPETGSEDDEETIAKAEAEAENVKEEIAALQKESEMDLDDLIKGLPEDYLKNQNNIKIESASSDDEASADEEFQASEEDSDDVEDTILEQENAEKDIDHQQEIDELNADNDLSIEELMAKYGKRRKVEVKEELDSDDVQESPDSDSAEETDDESEEDDVEKEDSKVGLKSLLDDENKDDSTNKDSLINDAAAIAESIQPKGNTLSSTNVVTPIPFLLKHTLREYQHIGLDWLVTMHDRKLNGILADEMGLGKTIQTIALLAHLACVKGNWGPHLIVVPSSVMLNWEMEFKKWCPSFKILTYYGSHKERKLKRVGWTKPNAFHVCITSYKLVTQDQQSFRRKKWKYLILDEAQNIKNFKSQRWQLLLNYSTEQRLLLTGTPLQNNLMELWSLMHFLMPHVFSSHREFKEWFSNPMTGMIEGNSEYNESIIKRLHKVLRPFLLRRLKSEVEKQMPRKYEHVIMCRLSKRQRYLYDDFMSRAKTRETLASGNLLSVINVLMQLRKVCNHPNLFEVRPTISPFQMEAIILRMPTLACNMFEYDPFKHIDLSSLNLILLQLELCLTAYVSYKVRKLQAPKKLIEEIDSLPPPPPKCPSGKYRFHIRVKSASVQENLVNHHNSSSSSYSSGVAVGTSPAMKTEGNRLVPIRNASGVKLNHKSIVTNQNVRIPILANIQNDWSQYHKPNASLVSAGPSNAVASINRGQIVSISANTLSNINTKHNVNFHVSHSNNNSSNNISISSAVPQYTQIIQTSAGRHIVLTPSSNVGPILSGGQRITVVGKSNINATSTKSVPNRIQNQYVYPSKVVKSESDQSLVQALAQQIQSTSSSENISNSNKVASTPSVKIEPTVKVETVKETVEDDIKKDPEFAMNEIEQTRKEFRSTSLFLMARCNQRRCESIPLYGEDCRNSICKVCLPCQSPEYSTWLSRSFTNCALTSQARGNWSLTKILKTYVERTDEMRKMFENFVIYVPAVAAPRPHLIVQHLSPSQFNAEKNMELTLIKEISPKLNLLHPIMSAQCTQFPDPRLIQYDCGKLQTLNHLLRKLKTEGHRVLIFTQMTKMLDVLEAFLNYHGHIYLRLDGTTKIEQRQILMERFNGDKRIFVFILSTRSGGVGVNLTGADTVIFYDSDWNPTMDAQAQDRCHRIGQTRDVHIYRLVSEKTIEENILKKANQKRMLGDLAIEGGNFTTAYFKTSTIQDLFHVEQEEDASTRLAEILERKNKSVVETASISGSNIIVNSGNGGTVSTGNEDKSTLGAFESALAAAEDEQDVEAAKTAKDEAAADLAEFDENIQLDDNCTEKPEMSKADQELENLVSQLSPIERYAMKFVEETGGAWTAAQLQAAEAEIEQQKREWEANRLAALAKEEENRKIELENDVMLTYSREDTSEQVNIKNKNKTNNTNKNLRTLNKKKFTISQTNKNKKVALIKKVISSKNKENRFTSNNKDSPKRLNRNANVKKPRNLNEKNIGRSNRFRENCNNKNKSTVKSAIINKHKINLDRKKQISKSRSKYLKTDFNINKKSKDLSSSKSKKAGVIKSKPSPKKYKPKPLSKRSPKKQSTDESSSESDEAELDEVHEEKTNSDDSENTAEIDDTESENNESQGDEEDLENQSVKNYSSVLESEEGSEDDYTGKENESEEAEEDDEDESDNTSVGECSLDVMMDSTTNDATTNSNNYRSDNDIETDESEQTDESDNSGNYEVKRSRLIKSSPNKKKPKKKIIQRNKLDMNSPRTTRSHGSVKINLWTLDVSPILPGRGCQSKSKTRNLQKKIIFNDKIKSTAEFSNLNSRALPKKKINDTNNDLSDPQLIHNRSVHFKNSNNKNDSVGNNDCNQIQSIKDDLCNSSNENEKQNNSTATAVSNNLKNQTLDKWLTKTPQVVLNRLTDIDTPKLFKSQLQPNQKDLRMTRRCSVLKSSFDNSKT